MANANTRAWVKAGMAGVKGSGVPGIRVSLPHKRQAKNFELKCVYLSSSHTSKWQLGPGIYVWVFWPAFRRRGRGGKNLNPNNLAENYSKHLLNIRNLGERRLARQWKRFVSLCYLDLVSHTPATWCLILNHIKIFKGLFATQHL